MAGHTRDDITRLIAGSAPVRLPGADLSGLDLSGLRLVGADLSYADLTGANLAHADMSGASLWSSRAGRASFRGAALSGANLGLSMLALADLRGAVLADADLTGAQLDGADLTGAQMQGTWLDPMQRAMAVGAPPLRFPEMAPPRTRILHCDDMPTPVILRCGDRLELRLQHTPQATHVTQSGLRGDAVIVGPERGTDAAKAMNLAFSAVSPGQARIRITQSGGAELSLNVMVTA